MENKKVNLYFVLFFISFVSFIVGFFLRENSSGGGLNDFGHVWFTISKLNIDFNNIFNQNYDSSRPPLFYILNHINPWSENKNGVLYFNFLFNLVIVLFFYLILKKINIFSKNVNFLLISILLLSPYFRSSSFWALEENLAYLFLILTIFCLHLNKKGYFFTIFFSCLTFYCDQKFVFLPIFIFLKYIFDKNINFKVKFNFFIFYILLSLPYFFLIYKWQGILPSAGESRLTFRKENFGLSISIIIFYFIPLFIYFFKIKNLKKYFQNNSSYNDIVIFIILFLFYYSILPDFNKLFGGGIIYKILFLTKEKIYLNIFLIKIIFISFNCFGSLLIYKLLLLNYKNYLPIVLVPLISCFTTVTHQEYFDPLIWLLIFLYFEFSLKIDNFLKLSSFYLIFYILLLSAANLYYSSIL